MKNLGMPFLLTAFLVGAIGNSVFASFEVKNVTKGELTVLVSYSQLDYFEYKLLEENDKLMINHGIDYIAAWVGRVEIPDVSDDKLAKNKNYNIIRGVHILKQISGDDSAAHSTGTQVSLRDSLAHYHEVVPTYAIKKDTNQLSLWLTGKEQ